MLLTLWSVKGGSGTSTVAAGLATALSRDRRPSQAGALLVDLCGDQPAVLGLAAPGGPGVLDWLATDGGDAAALHRLEAAMAAGTALLPAGTRDTVDTWPDQRAHDLASALQSDGRPVVVDAGVPSGGASRRLVDALVGAGSSLLVVRPCYLALRRAVALQAGADPVRTDGVVLVAEPGRALDTADVERALDLPVRAVVEADPAVARAVDAGLLASRLPRAFARSVAGLAAEEAA